jgi:hypothetical protein
MANPKNELAEKVEKYEKLTQTAVKEIKLKQDLTQKELSIAKDFLDMAQNYFNDAKYFKKQGNLLTSLAAFSYAHAWLDAGVRAKLFETTNDQLFTLP